MTDKSYNCQEARALRHLLTSANHNIDRGDGMAMRIAELHMRISHISDAYEAWVVAHAMLPRPTPFTKHLDRWRYAPIENIGVCKGGVREVWHPDKGRHVGYAIYYLAPEYHDTMREVGLDRGWLRRSDIPVAKVGAHGQMELV